MLLKHIFSQINIPNLLNNIKKYFTNDHFANIEETLQKFIVCSIDKCYISLFAVLFIKSRSLVSPDSVLLAVKDTPLLGLKILLLH